MWHWNSSSEEHNPSIKLPSNSEIVVPHSRGMLDCGFVRRIISGIYLCSSIPLRWLLRLYWFVPVQRTWILSNQRSRRSRSNQITIDLFPWQQLLFPMFHSWVTEPTDVCWHQKVVLAINFLPPERQQARSGVSTFDTTVLSVPIVDTLSAFAWFPTIANTELFSQPIVPFSSCAIPCQRRQKIDGGLIVVPSRLISSCHSCSGNNPLTQCWDGLVKWRQSCCCVWRFWLCCKNCALLHLLHFQDSHFIFEEKQETQLELLPRWHKVIPKPGKFPRKVEEVQLPLWRPWQRGKWKRSSKSSVKLSFFWNWRYVLM